MTVIEQPAAAATRRRGGASRFAGLAFAVLFLAGFVILGAGPSIYEGGSLAEYAEAHAGGARMAPVALSAFVLLPMAGGFLIWAVSRMSLADGGPSLAGRVATAGSVVMASGTTIAGAAYGAALHVSSGTGDGFPADPGSGYALELLASQVMSVSLWGGSLVLLAVGIGSLRTGCLPRGLLWAGVAVSPVLAVGFMVFNLPLLVFLVWVAVGSAIVKTGSVEESPAGAIAR